MRILFTRFPLESARGGAEKQVLSLMKGLREHGHDVAFLGSCPVLLEETAALLLPHAELDIGPPPVTKIGAVSFTWRKRTMQKKLEAALDAFGKIDAIVMISMSEKLLLTDECVRKGIKVFWLEHDRVGRWLTKNPWLSVLRRLSMTAVTICVSELSKGIFVDLGWDSQKVIAIPNGIDVAGCPVARCSISKNDGGLNIGCVARLSPEKGVDVLIHAVKNLAVTLTIVGDGPEKEKLRQQATSNQQPVNFLHRVDTLPDFYRTIDVLVLPSRDNDPFGLVVAEAMACGTPVIVTDQCGIAGYLVNGTDALIVPADSAEALQEAIQRLSADTALRQKLSEKGRRTAEQKFAAEKMIDRYEALMRA